MSVLQSKRYESKVQYITEAINIEIETLKFVSKLSKRFTRLLSPKITDLCISLVNECEMANAAYPSSEEAISIRRQHLINASGYLKALDVQLTVCYNIIMENINSAFDSIDVSKIAERDRQKAERKNIDRLDKLAQTVGDLINKESNLLKGVLDSVKYKD